MKRETIILRSDSEAVTERSVVTLNCRRFKFKYETPSQILIIFNPREDGTCSHPLKIYHCTEIDTGKLTVVKYIARDNRVHKHYYYYKDINMILTESGLTFKQNKKRWQEKKGDSR